MSLIKPRSRGKRLVRHRTRLDHATNATLYAYALFIGESTEYVLNQVIDTVLARDKDFLQWRVTHPDAGVPNSTDSDRPRRRVNGRAQTMSAPPSGHGASAGGHVDAH